MNSSFFLNLIEKSQQYCIQHGRAALSSLGKCWEKPLATTMTLLVISLALALPTGLLVLLNNVSHLTTGLNQQTQILVFLNPQIERKTVNQLLKTMKNRKDVTTVRYISPDEGLAMFKTKSGFGDALEYLPNNPLPGVIEVTPHAEITSPAALEKLTYDLKILNGVDAAKLDLDWIKKLFSLLQLGTRATIALLALFGIGVLLIIGNTIRLSTLNQVDEIEITKLIGATDAFIRRPFLYTGFWYGLGGGILAWCLVSTLLLWLSAPTEALASLYHSHFHLQGLGLENGLKLLLTSIGLGLIGAFAAVTRELKAFDPI